MASSLDVLATDDFTVTIMPEVLSVGRISRAALPGCTWPAGLFGMKFGSIFWQVMQARATIVGSRE